MRKKKNETAFGQQTIPSPLLVLGEHKSQKKYLPLALECERPKDFSCEQEDCLTCFGREKQIDSLGKRPVFASVWVALQTQCKPGDGRSSVFLEESQGAAKAGMPLCQKLLLLKGHNLRSIKALESKVPLPGILNWAYKLNFRAVVICKHTYTRNLNYIMKTLLHTLI